MVSAVGASMEMALDAARSEECATYWCAFDDEVRNEGAAYGHAFRAAELAYDLALAHHGLVGSTCTETDAAVARMLASRTQ